MMTTQTYSQQIHDYTENPFGLVYDGAITGNTPRGSEHTSGELQS